MVDGVRGQPVALERIGADVGEERGVDGDDDAVAREPDARVVRLLAVVTHAREVLATVLDPLDRPAEPVGRRRHQDLLRIDRALRAEAAADVGDDDADVLDRQPERGRDHIAQRVRALRGRRHDERSGVAIAVRDGTARLDGRGAETRMPQALADDEMRPGHRRFRVTDGAAGHDRGVVGPALVQPRSGRERRFGRRQGRQRCVLDGHRVERVGEEREALRHHDGHRLPDVADHVPGQHGLRPRASLLRAAVGGRHVWRDRAEICGAPGEDDAGKAPGRVGGHGDEPRVGLGAPDDAEMQEPVAREVVEETPAARQEPLVPLASR